MILKLEEIHTYYGLVHMLQGVSLGIAEGEVVALLGRNGAGKTTALNSIMGLVPLRQGKVLFEDQDITGLPPHMIARRGLAYVPASRGIFSALTAMENLEIVRTKGARWGHGGRFPALPQTCPVETTPRACFVWRRAADACHRPRLGHRSFPDPPG